MTKSRDLWIHDFISNLQLEYISYYMRWQIYERPIDKKRFSDICTKKSDKIAQMAFRNGVQSLFTSDDIWNKYVNKFLGSGIGLPAFQYVNDEQKKRTGYWDKYYFFKAQNKIIYKNEEYVIVRNYIRTEEVVITIDGQLEKIPYEKVKRSCRNLLEK